jgi:hypothetical protein
VVIVGFWEAVVSLQ